MNLKYKARIVQTVHHNPFCLLEFIKKEKGMPKNPNTLRKLVNKLLQTTFFNNVIHLGKEYFYIDRFENPDCYNFKTFYLLNEVVFEIIESNQYLKKINAYQKQIKYFNVSSLFEVKKSSFSGIPPSYPHGFNIHGDHVGQILSKFFPLYYLKVKLYFRTEQYKKKGIKTLIPLNTVGRVNDISDTLYDFKQFLEQPGTAKIGSIYQNYVLDLSKKLDRDYEDSLDIYNKMSQYLTTKSVDRPSKRTVRNSKQLIEILGSMARTGKDSVVRRLGGINNFKNATKGILDNQGKADVGKLLRRRAKEKATNILFVDDQDIEEFVLEDMIRNPIKIDEEF